MRGNDLEEAEARDRRVSAEDDRSEAIITETRHGGRFEGFPHELAAMARQRQLAGCAHHGAARQSGGAVVGGSRCRQDDICHSGRLADRLKRNEPGFVRGRRLPLHQKGNRADDQQCQKPEHMLVPLR